MYELQAPIYIPSEALYRIFAKLPRAELELLQQVSAQFRAVISSNEFTESGPLMRLALLEVHHSKRYLLWAEKETMPYFRCHTGAELALHLKKCVVDEVR